MTQQNVQGPESAQAAQAQSETDDGALRSSHVLAQKLHQMIREALSSEALVQEVAQCFEAAGYLVGLRQQKNPGSVAKVLLALESHLFEQPWGSQLARAEGNARLGLAQLGTDGALNEEVFTSRLVGLALPRVPSAFRAVSSLFNEDWRWQALVEVAARCDRDPEGFYHPASFYRAHLIAHGMCIFDQSLPSYALVKAFESAKAAQQMLEIEDPDQTRLSRIEWLSRIACFAAEAAILADVAHVLAACDPPQGSIVEFVQDTSDQAHLRYTAEVVQILCDMNMPGCHWLELLGTQDRPQQTLDYVRKYWGAV